MPGTLAIDLGSSTTVVAWQDGTASPPRLLALAPYALDDPAVVPSLIWLAVPDGAANPSVLQKNGVGETRFERPRKPCWSRLLVPA